MRYEQKKLVKFGVIVLTALVLAAPTTVVAQRRSPGGVTGGDRLRPGTYANQRASRNMRHARDYSRGLYRYSRDVRTIQPQVAKTESAELGRNIESAKKVFTTVREEYAGDKEVLASLKVIEDHLATAAAQHKMLHAECQKDAIDGTVNMDCCNTITKELEKAIAEHSALMRKLEINEGSEAAKDRPSTTNE